MISEFGGAPKVITSDAQHEGYVSTLLELERRESGGRLGLGAELSEAKCLCVDSEIGVPSAQPTKLSRSFDL